MKSSADGGSSAADDGRATAATVGGSKLDGCTQVPVVIESMPPCCDIIGDEQVSDCESTCLRTAAPVVCR